MRKYITVLFIAAVAAMVLSVSPARGATLGFHVGSAHFPKDDNNNFNPGAYVISDSGWTLGTYRNSQRRQSFYGGWTYVHKLDDDVNAGLQIGVVTGYRRRVDTVVCAHGSTDCQVVTHWRKRRVLPALVPSVGFRVHGDWWGRIVYLPKVEKGGSHVLHLTIERSF